jgi:hypothetical protein
MAYTTARGAAYTTATMQEAAESGDRPMCEFLYAHQCPWDYECCLNAARASVCDNYDENLNLLRWFRQHGCPWYVEELACFAAHTDSVALLEFMQQQGVEFTTGQLTILLSVAGADDSLTTAKWLKQQGAEWPEVLQDCGLYTDGEQWYGDTLAWARAEGCTAPLDYHYGNRV